MSWDVMLFSSTQRIESVEDVDEEKFLPIEFNGVFEKHFSSIEADEDYRKIKGSDFTINYSVDELPVSTLLVNLSGEAALYQLIAMSKEFGLQIFDTGSGEMIDLNQPERNGFKNYQTYLKQILNNSNRGK